MRLSTAEGGGKEQGGRLRATDRWRGIVTVLVAFMATWFFAASPIRRSVSLKATYDGVVRLPWSLAMISTLRGKRGFVAGYVAGYVSGWRATQGCVFGKLSRALRV